MVLGPCSQCPSSPLVVVLRYLGLIVKSVVNAHPVGDDVVAVETLVMLDADEVVDLVSQSS